MYKRQVFQRGDEEICTLVIPVVQWGGDEVPSLVIPAKAGTQVLANRLALGLRTGPRFSTG